MAISDSRCLLSEFFLSSSRMAAFTFSERITYRKLSSAVAAGCNIILLSPGQIAHDRGFRFFPFPFQPFFIHFLSHTAGKLIVQIQFFIIGLIPLNSRAADVSLQREIQKTVCRIRHAVMQPLIHHLTVLHINRTADHSGQ